MKGQTLIPSRPHADNSPPKIIDCCVTVYVHLGECYHPINIISPDTYRRAYKMLQHCMYCFIILSPTVDCCIIYLPPPFKDIPNIYSASPARKPTSVLCPCPPPLLPLFHEAAIQCLYAKHGIVSSQKERWRAFVLPSRI